MSTSSYHTRVNDHALSLGMERYSNGDKDNAKHLWKFVVSKHCGHTELASIEVTVSDLVKIKIICEKAIETLRSDGDRNPKAVEAA